jgi:hypothetical protein
LELSGDPAAVDTTRRARSLATTAGQALRLGVREVWLRVKVALPGNVGELGAARAVAESLLAVSHVENARDAAALASLAALLGDATTAASLAERGVLGETPDAIPPHVAGTANALLVYAAMGGPADRIQSLEQRLRSSIASGVVREQQGMARDVYLSRALALAYPVHHSPMLADLDSTGDALLAAELAHRRGDSAAVKRTIASIDRIRRNVMAADITLEALVPEAWLLSAIGDTAAALRRVSATLDALGSVPASKFENPVTAGALVQCMLLRAELARRSAPRESIAWARAIEAISDTTKPHSWMRTRRWRPLTK